MSQKKAKLLKKFFLMSGIDNTGKQWFTDSEVMDKKGNLIKREHILRDDKRVKQTYSGATAKDKAMLSRDMRLFCVKLPS